MFLCSARYLEENAVVEWRKAYINYRGLKRVIKLVAARRKARLSLDLSPQSSRISSRIIASTIEGLRRRPLTKSGSNAGSEGTNDSAYVSQLRNRRQSFGENGSGDGLMEEDQSSNLPQVTLKGTGLNLASNAKDGASAHTTASTTANGAAAKEEGKAKIIHPHADPDVEGEAQEIHQEPTTGTRDPNSPDGNATGRTSNHTKGSKKAQKRTSKVINLDSVISDNFDSQEGIFFEALDSELERVVSFYEQREKEMASRYEMLARQLKELSEHRKEYKLSQQDHIGDLGRRLSNLVTNPQGLKRVSLNMTRPTSGHDSPMPTRFRKSEEISAERRASIDEGERRRAAALHRMSGIAGRGLSEAEDEELRRLNKAAAQSHDPERYKAARKKLKAAILEYYRGLEILKNYKILNRTGFAKILKKFEKTVELSCADAYYNAKVTPSILVSSESVEKLIKGTEEIFTAYFEHGNRKRALQRLRINASVNTGEPSSTHHLSVARAGFYLGIALVATVGGLIEVFQTSTQEAIPQWPRLMRVYGAEFLPTLFALLFGLNLAIWHRARVNTVFIFEWDVRHALDYHQYFELPAFFLLLLSLAFWVSFLNPFPSAIAPTTWPLVWLVVVVAILLNPLPMTIYYSRRWMVTSLARLLQGGFIYNVEFRDFFLGDELNSLNWSVSMTWFFICEYNTNWPTSGQCDPNKTWWTAVLLSIPAFLRFTQCFRRFYDSKLKTRLHLINAGKYASSILNYWFYVHYRYHGSQYNHTLALWCVFASLNSIYTSIWDVTLDWSLLRPHARYPWLRDELVFESYWPFYYWAIITNIILRFGWVIYLLPGPASNLTRIFVIAFLEMMRRWQWNFIRLENEHLGNVDMYRISREIPLPYHFKLGQSKEDDDDEEKMSTIRKIRGALGRRSHQELDEHLERSESPHVAFAPEVGAPLNKDDRKRHDHLEVPSGECNGDKGKQRNQSTNSSERGYDYDVDKEGQGEGQSRRERITQKIIDHLVPDRGGMGARGDRLDEVGATRGASARDYQPRRLEPDGDNRSSREGTSDEGEEDEEAEEDMGKYRKKKS